ncbi:unnamed protein product [Brugia timori]|uniref:Macro domain-containing protein n=1 Tax=Brugia timori TaxID=42155 RepID=A0A0R3R0E2_9BILA|nr:unnamed protein product [Brugia timori]
MAGIKKWSEVATAAELTKSNNPLAKLIAIDKGDITKFQVDAIVNAANSSLLGGMVFLFLKRFHHIFIYSKLPLKVGSSIHFCVIIQGGGVDGAIHRAAGRCLYDECKKLNGCKVGEAKMTGAYDMKHIKNVIHTVGPQVHSGVSEEQRNLLKSCYIKSLNIAIANNLRTIAFPCISTGVYGYPNDEACDVVVTSVLAWLQENKDKIDRIIFVTFLDKDYDLYEKCLKERLT